MCLENVGSSSRLVWLSFHVPRADRPDVRSCGPHLLGCWCRRGILSMGFGCVGTTWTGRFRGIFWNVYGIGKCNGDHRCAKKKPAQFDEWMAVVNCHATPLLCYACAMLIPFHLISSHLNSCVSLLPSSLPSFPPSFLPSFPKSLGLYPTRVKITHFLPSRILPPQHQNPSKKDQSINCNKINRNEIL